MLKRPFQSLSEFVDYAENDTSNDGPAKARSSIAFHESFTQVPNKAHAFQMLRKGYPDGTKRMQTLLDRIQHAITLPTMTQQIENDVEGCAPDVEAFLQGRPEDMFLFSSVETSAPPTFLPVQVEMSCDSSILPSQINWAGAILFAAIEALRLQGCQVEYHLSHTVSNGRNEMWQSAIPLPSNLDLDTLSFLLTHPAANRVLVFSTQEHEFPDTKQQFGFSKGRGYGWPVDNSPKLENCTQQISLTNLCHLIPLNDAQALSVSVKMLQTLVDTKFQQYN